MWPLNDLGALAERPLSTCTLNDQPERSGASRVSGGCPRPPSGSTAGCSIVAKDRRVIASRRAVESRWGHAAAAGGGPASPGQPPREEGGTIRIEGRRFASGLCIGGGCPSTLSDNQDRHDNTERRTHGHGYGQRDRRTDTCTCTGACTRTWMDERSQPNFSQGGRSRHARSKPDSRRAAPLE